MLSHNETPAHHLIFIPPAMQIGTPVSFSINDVNWKLFENALLSSREHERYSR